MNWTTYLIDNEIFINIICNIFTSIGTVGAVIVSLYLSYKGNTPKIRINVKRKIQPVFNVITSSFDDTKSFVAIEIVNLGFVPVELNCFFWSTGLFRKKYYYQLPSAFDQSLSSPIHQVLNYHQTANFYIALDLFIEGAKHNIKKSNYLIVNWIRSRCYFITMKSNIGNIYKSRIHKSLSSEILKML